MSIEEIIHAEWTLHPDNPLIYPPFLSPLIADPTIITPDNSPDQNWHLFAHSLKGIHHYTSSDGIQWRHLKKIISGALRPYIFCDNGHFYLYYEKVGIVNMAMAMLSFKKWYSLIEVVSSNDLIHWSKPQVVLRPTMAYAQEEDGSSAVSNPCVLKQGDEYWLYFSSGLVYVPDCQFNEPRHIGVAKGNTPLGPFVAASQPIISPDTSDPWNNLGAGSIKVISFDQKLLGFQNGIYEKDGRSGSAIKCWLGNDENIWTPANQFPLLKPSGTGWMATHIYACDVKLYRDKWYLFFNARTAAHWSKGIERIGLLTSNV